MRGLVAFGFHLMGENQRQLNLSLTNQTLCVYEHFKHRLDTTNELLTSRIGLITLAHTIQVLDLSKTIDQRFPASGSNCALKAPTFN